MSAPAPLTLAIEVSNPSADAAPPPTGASGAFGASGATADATGPSVAIARGPHILDQEPLRTPDARHDDDLMPAIDRLVRRAGLTPQDIHRIAVSIGPGGFTGLRVAIATAKAIGETIIARDADPANCIPVPTALVAARALADAALWPAATPHAPARIGVALASKRDTAHLTLLDTPDHIASAALADAPALERLHAQRPIALLLADRFLPESMRAAAQRLGIAVRPPTLSAAACARAAHSIPPVDPAQLLPLYPREPEAVTKWRALHPR